MPTLDDLRTAAEAKLKATLKKLDDHHRAMLRAAIERYGSVRGVPDSVWQSIVDDQESAEAAAVLLLLMKSADEWTMSEFANLGVDVVPLSDQGLGYYAVEAARRTRAMAEQATATTRDRLERKLQDSQLTGPGVVGELTSAGIDDALDDVFTDSRRDTTAADLTTSAFSHGQIGARDRQLGDDGKAPVRPIGGDGASLTPHQRVTLELTWRTERDNRVCPRCSPLEGTPESIWSLVFPDGPGSEAHPNCRCWLQPQVIVDAVESNFGESSGHWVTVNGHHVLIDGPKELKGRKSSTGIEQIEVNNQTVKVFRNPSMEVAKAMLDRHEEVRGLVDKKTGDYYLWDGSQAVHFQMAKSLGLDHKQFSHRDGPSWSTDNPGRFQRDVSNWAKGIFLVESIHWSKHL